MSKRPKDLPDFDRPPLTEMYMGVQFEPLPLPLAGLINLWQTEYRRDYPKIEEQQPLPGSVETFGAAPTVATNMLFSMTGAAPEIRVLFIAESDNELVQVQTDRFVRNWRQRSEDDFYPRYEKARKSFARDFDRFLAWMRKREIPVTIVQCEIGYVNMITLGPDSDLDRPVQPGRALRILDTVGPLVDCETESAGVAASWVDRVDGRPLARLRVNAGPARHPVTGRPAVNLTLGYRGAPKSPDRSGILAFMDRGRDKIVRSFAELTRDELQDLWGRKREE